MKSNSATDNKNSTFSRRNFIKTGGVLVAGAALPALNSCTSKIERTQLEDENLAVNDQYRILGRTGFKVFTVGLGEQGPEENLIKYAYKKGVNYIDTAESYRNGNSERTVGKALKYIDRKKVFITTKLGLWNGENFKERFLRCLGRLQTDYVDALCIHSVGKVEDIYNKDFHKATTELKAEGKLKYIGISSHGSEEDNGDTMEKVLGTAAEDGRFDLLLIPYNFMNKDSAEKVIQSCKKNSVGTTIMKTSPGIIEAESSQPIDPENLSDEEEKEIQQIMADEGWSKKEAIENMNEWRADALKTVEKVKPFAEKYGAASNEQLRLVGLKWVLQNPDIHTACMTINTFEEVDKFIPAAGSGLTSGDNLYIHEFKSVYNDLYCRHSCQFCAAECIHNLPVSRIMRYSYYFRMQRKEKYAMSKYAQLGGLNAGNCRSCHAPCIKSCPYGLNVKINLLNAHSLLKIA